MLLRIKTTGKILGKHRSLQILLLIGGYLLVAAYLPLKAQQSLYAISLFLKDLLLWMLPITVGFFISYAISSFEKKAPVFVLFLFVFEAISNAASVWYAFACGHLVVNDLDTLTAYAGGDALEPLWRLPFLRPSWWSADKGTLLGLFLGIFSSFKKGSWLKELLSQGKEKMEKILTRFFSRLIPFFILGFVAKMHQTKLFHQLFYQISLWGWLLCFLSLYLAFLFFLGSGFCRKTFLRNVGNLLPAGGVAFSSGCSLSTMPWTIEGTAKNLKDPTLAKAVIPATTNIQQVGDCIANAFFCFWLYYQKNGICPDIFTWLSFSLVFVLARFATAAVLGGAIFIMLPIYEAYLGFTPEMIAIILALNVILDPLITSSNVMANGALCRIFEKVWTWFLKHPVEGEPVASKEL